MHSDDQEEVEYSMAVAAGGGSGSCFNYLGMDHCSYCTMTCLCWWWEWVVSVLHGNAKSLSESCNASLQRSLACWGVDIVVSGKI